MSDAVLDSSAVLAFLLAEPGANNVQPFLGRATMSTVNVSEVVARMMDKGPSENMVRGELRKLRLSICDFDEELAYAAGALREKTKEFGLSLGDRACIATASHLRLPVLTADRQWADIDVGVKIVLIRTARESWLWREADR